MDEHELDVHGGHITYQHQKVVIIASRSCGSVLAVGVGDETGLPFALVFTVHVLA